MGQSNINERQMPVENERYWYITKVGKIVTRKFPALFKSNGYARYIGTARNNAEALWRSGNYYKTREQAEKAAERVNAAYWGGEK